ncbi:methylaspartate mutase subunit S [Litoreibacter albidus]|uniref:methylaspartate mutase subunit S n=1 Tax=Litoreibacter albidus TaxID=670155 RepID=UPI0037360049
MERNYKIILGVIGSDCHVVGNRILDRVLSNGGIEVINLGVMVDQTEFVEEAIEHGADAILVSSIYGHGEIDCDGLRQRCEDSGIGDITLYVGGNLVIGKKDWSEVEQLFLEMGYDRVFPPSCELPAVMDLLRDDIDMRRLSHLGHNSSNAALHPRVAA